MAMSKALDRKKLIAELERERRKRVDARLRELRALIKAARTARREQIALVKAQCKAARIKLRDNCRRRVDSARASGAADIDARKRDFHGERYDEKMLRVYDARGIKRTSMRSTRAERRAESDDEVRHNIPDELTRVFDHVKKHIRGNSRKSRTEAFLEWAQENPDEIYAIQQRDADRELNRMIAEHHQLEREKHRRPRSRSRSAVALDEVPF